MTEPDYWTRNDEIKSLRERVEKLEAALKTIIGEAQSGVARKTWRGWASLGRRGIADPDPHHALRRCKEAAQAALKTAERTGT